nr:SDR family NAD(P)-dependent oxidoreductase [Streptomyces cellulosae]
MTDTTRFEGYGVLITGAARGIGAATARRFAEEGARVLVTDVDGPTARDSSRARVRPSAPRPVRVAPNVTVSSQHGRRYNRIPRVPV